MTLIGPADIRKRLDVAHSFMGDWEAALDVYELPQLLDTPLTRQDSDMEETKEEVKETELHD